MIAYLIPAKEDDYPSLYKQINSNYLEYILPRNKLSVTQARDIYNKELLPDFKKNGINLVVCFDAVFYQAIYKACKPSVEIGYIRTTPEVNITYLPSMSNMFYFPEETKEDYDFGIKQINNYLAGKYSEPGDIIHKGIYPNSYLGITDTLCELLKYDRLTCDIETFSLKHPTAGLASISFAWNEHEGVAFLVDDRFTKERNTRVRILLKDFFEVYKGKLIFHNISFDATVLIYQLWMKYITDTEGLLKGLSVMLNNFDDTKILTYLATNNCTANHLSLKEQSKHFAGNYAQENITDLTLIPTKELLEYNLKDTLSTWFVFNKWNDKVDTDKQRNIYETLFKPALVDIIQMQLTGLPINMPRVIEVKKELTSHRDKALATIMNNRYVISFTVKLNKLWVENRNKVLKKKKITLADAKEVFNPNSNLQLRELFYDTLGLPVLSTTKKKEPSTDAATLEKLLNHTNDDKVKELIKALLDYFAVDKILTTFIPAFEEAFYSKEDNWHYLFGNFNLGGTVSGRLSSSNPNLQNLPATGSKYAKIIKSCFSAPPGWLFVGLDFASLEDRISTLTTKDPNKLAVYEHGYDGHCFRAFAYFKDDMPDIVEEYNKCSTEEEKVKVINSIKKKYPKLRQESKAPTFALTYQAVPQTLMKNCGFSEEKAKQIFDRFHELYKVSDEWVNNKLKEAEKNGYLTVAFGLRVRTNKIHQSIMGIRQTPREAEEERRTAANALGQSYCLLNNRAGIEFNDRVRKSEYKYAIRPVAHIHDAEYFLVKDDIDVILYSNKYLIQAVSWQEDPEIWHPNVHLGGEFSIFYPDWAHEFGVPNKVSEPELIAMTKQYIEELTHGNNK